VNVNKPSHSSKGNVKKKGTGYFLNLIVVIASEAWQSLIKDKRKITEKMGPGPINCPCIPHKLPNIACYGFGGKPAVHAHIIATVPVSSNLTLPLLIVILLPNIRKGQKI